MCEREPERARESQREPKRARESQSEPEREAGHTSSMPQHCFVEKQLNTTLFCRENTGLFYRKTLKYAL